MARSKERVIPLYVVNVSEVAPITWAATNDLVVD
jgi:hypothetical protein